MTEKSKMQWMAVDITEEDVIEAMAKIPGYLDITPGDFREVYRAAWTMAVGRLMASRTAAELMSCPVAMIEGTTDLARAAALLAEKGISGAPVIDDQGKIAGVVSEKDFLKEMGFGATPSFMQIATHCLHDKSCMIGRLHGKTVADIMTAPPIIGTQEMTIGEISALFAERGINRLPIVDAGGRPQGIVTRTDLAHSFREMGEQLRP